MLFNYCARKKEEKRVKKLLSDKEKFIANRMNVGKRLSLKFPKKARKQRKNCEGWEFQ